MHPFFVVKVKLIIFKYNLQHVDEGEWLVFGEVNHFQIQSTTDRC